MNKMILKFKYLTLFFVFLISSCSFSENFRELPDLFLDDDFEGKGKGKGKGEVKLDIVLKEMGTNKEIEKKIFNYHLKKNGFYVDVKIPLGYYYIDEPASGFDQNYICSQGGASSGYKLTAYRKNIKSNIDFLVKNEWSCGSMGCSYLLTFGNKKHLQNYCKGEIK